MAVVLFDGRQLHVLERLGGAGRRFARLIEPVSRNKRLLTGPHTPRRWPRASSWRSTKTFIRPATGSRTSATSRRPALGARGDRRAARAFAPTATGRKIMLFLSGGWPYDRYSLAGLNWETMKDLMGYQDRTASPCCGR